MDKCNSQVLCYYSFYLSVQPFFGNSDSLKIQLWLWSILFVSFQFYQKKWLLEFGGSSQSIFLLLNRYVFTFRYLGIGYLIVYAIDESINLETWWYGIVSAIALYIISWFVSLVFIMVESVLPFDNLYKVSAFGFLGFIFLPILFLLLTFDTTTILWLFF